MGKNKTTVLQVYKRYLSKINGWEPAEVPTNFGKMMDFLYNELDFSKEDELKLWGMLSRDCVYQTLKVVKRKNIRLKELSEDWNANTVQEVWRLQGIVDNYDEIGDTNSYTLAFRKLWTIIDSEEDMALKLYLHLSHQERSNNGSNFYKRDTSKVREMLAQVSDKTPAPADEADEAEAEAPNT